LIPQAMTMEVKKEILMMSHQAPAAWTTLCTSLQSFGKLFSPSYRPQVSSELCSNELNIICLLFPLRRKKKWKIDFYGGYLCFVVSILSIGVVTAIIGDVASMFGCTLGIKDSVTAIVFVALGTSIPGF
jgi:hypothetical protein